MFEGLNRKELVEKYQRCEMEVFQLEMDNDAFSDDEDMVYKNNRRIEELEKLMHYINDRIGEL